MDNPLAQHKLTADQLVSILLSHMLNNNLSELKIYRPTQLQDDDKFFIKCGMSMGEDEKGFFVKFTLEQEKIK